MNRLGKRIGAAVSFGLLAAGCGAEADSGQGSASEIIRDPDALLSGTGDGVFTEAAELGALDDRPVNTPQGARQETVTLNRFSVGEAVIEFQELRHPDGTSSFLIVETASANGPELLTQRLRKEAGGLTALETFYALAPDGAIPHERLVAHHPEQAGALNRSDDSVHRVDFDAEQLIEKSTSSCWDKLLSTSKPWEYAGMYFNRSGNFALCAGVNYSCGYYVTNTQVDMTWCNESSAAMTRAWAIGEADVNNGAWQSEHTASLAAGKVVGMGVVPQPDSRRYYMRGISSGPKYHLGFLIHEQE